MSNLVSYASYFLSYIKVPPTEKTTIIGRLGAAIIIFAHKNDKTEWEKCEKSLLGHCQYSKFTEKPVLYTLNQPVPNFRINTPTRTIECVIERDCDMTNNHCITRQSTAITDKNQYKAILNYPIELLIELKEGQTITTNGFFDKNEIFHITSISNYDIIQ